MNPTPLVCLYETAPVTVDATRSVPRLLAQLLRSLATYEDQFHVVVVGLPGTRLEECRVLPTPLSLSERAMIRLRRADSSSIQQIWIRKALKSIRQRGIPIGAVICLSPRTAILTRDALRDTVKIVHWSHGHPNLIEKSSANDQFLLEASKCVDQLVVPSQALYRVFWERFHHKCYPPPVSIIPNWVDTQVFAPLVADERNVARQRFGLSDDEIAIAHVGGHALNKGRKILETALCGCDGPRKLAVLSAGDARKSQTQLRSNVRTVDLGRLSPSEMARLYGCCDLGVVPSVCFDTMPLAVLEMMSAGLSVVASRVGGIPEMIDDGETGFLVDLPNDVDSWICRLQTVMNDDDLRVSTGKQARRAATNRFDGRDSFQHWRKLLQRLTDSQAETDSKPDQHARPTVAAR